MTNNFFCIYKQKIIFVNAIYPFQSNLILLEHNNYSSSLSAIAAHMDTLSFWCHAWMISGTFSRFSNLGAFNFWSRESQQVLNSDQWEANGMFYDKEFLSNNFESIQDIVLKYLWPQLLFFELSHQTSIFRCFKS